MLRGLSTQETQTVVLEIDPGFAEDGNHSPQATQFTIRTLDGYTSARLRDMQAQVRVRRFDAGLDPDQMDMTVAMYAPALEACRWGLLGWENFMGDDDKPLPFVTEKVTLAGKEYVVPTRDTLAMIPPMVAVSLMHKVSGTARLSEDEEKNSDGAS